MNTYQKWYRWIGIFLVAAGLLSLLVIFMPFGVAEAEDQIVSNTSVFPGSVELVTKSADGNGVYAYHAAQGMAEDGSFVFTSKATNLVSPPTTPGEERFYFFDNTAKTVTVLPSFGTDSFLTAQITPDKQWILLGSFDYTLQIHKVSLYNTFTAELIAVKKGDGKPVSVKNSSMTADGSIVAFTSLEQLSTADTNGKFDVYVWHRDTKAIELASKKGDGTAAGIETFASISADGTYVSYIASGSNFPACGATRYDVYRQNLLTSEVLCVSGAVDDSDYEVFRYVEMSSDGSKFYFLGIIDGIQPKITNVYLVDLGSGTTSVVFDKTAYASVAFNRLTADGTKVVYAKVDDRRQLNEACTYEVVSAEHSCLSKPEDAQQGSLMSISPTGRYSVIWSWDHSWIGSIADNLKPNGDRSEDLFIWDREGVNNAISGKVTGDDGVTGLADVVLTNGSREKYKTDANGQYTMPYLTGGQTYVITPTVTISEFYPASKLVTVPTAGSVDFSTKNPVQSVVVFIPGVAGSTQLSENKVDLWPGLSTIAGLLFGDTYKRLSLEGGVVESGVIAGDAIRVASLPFGFESKPIVKNLVDSTIVYKPFLDYMVNELGYREYHVNNDPDKRASTCKTNEQTNQPNLFIFAYDWRLDITDNVGLLGDYIDCIHNFYPGMKVTLIGHSMGGLLARKYIVSGGESNVKTLITINTPWLGAPKVLQTMLDGTWQWPYSRPILKQLVKYFPGAYQLIPSARYLTSVALPPFREGDFDLDNDGILDESYQNMSDFDGFFQALGYTTVPYSVNSTFYDSMFLDPTAGSSVQHFSLITQQEENTTTGQIYNETEVVCNTSASGTAFSCNTLSLYMVHAVKGDGTVPLDSLQGLLKAKIGTTTRFVSPGSESDHRYGHKEATSNPNILAAISSILSGNTEVQAATVETEGDHISRYVRLHGVEALTITHPISGSISSTDHTLDFFSFPGVSVNQEGESGYLITMAPDATYDITYKASKPVFLQTNSSDGGSNVRVSQNFNNQPQAQNGELTLHISGNPETSLTYQTSQGVVEVQPTGSYTATSPLDKTPPVVTIRPTANGQVEVVAEDDSALGGIYVSTGGALYHAYSQPLMVPSGTIVTAFADDVVGNRSSVVSYTVQVTNSTKNVYLPLVQR